MFNIDDITNEDIMRHNPNWPQSPGYPQIILICGGSESGKANALLNSITNQQILIKFIYMIKIHIKQNISC